MAVMSSPDVRIQTLDRQRGFFLEAETFLPRSLEEVFAFFSDAFNLEVVTPDELHFKILTPAPIKMREGLVLDYSIKLMGVRVKWRNRITEWRPGERFCDEQVKGPFKFWKHEHVFIPVEGGTRVIDRVHFGVPGGMFVYHLMVKSELERMFAFRHQKLCERFDA